MIPEPIFLTVGIGSGVALLLFAMHKTAQMMVLAPPIKVPVKSYQVVFSQRGWSFVTASIEQKRTYFNTLQVWRKVYEQERRFGEGAWGYGMSQLKALSGRELEILANNLVDSYLALQNASSRDANASQAQSI